MPWLRATGDSRLKEPRPFCGTAAWLTIRRAKLRCGGTAARFPAFGPSTAAFVGRTLTLMLLLMWLFTVTFVICVGETLTLFLATFREFRIVSRDTAVNPFRTCMFA